MDKKQDKNQGTPRPRVPEQERIFKNHLSAEDEYQARYGPPLEEIDEEIRPGIQMARSYMDMLS